MKHRDLKLLKRTLYLGSPVGTVVRTEGFHIHGVIKKFPVMLELGQTQTIAHLLQILHIMGTIVSTFVKNEVKNIIGVIKTAVSGGTVHREKCTKRQ